MKVLKRRQRLRRTSFNLECIARLVRREGSIQYVLRYNSFM